MIQYIIHIALGSVTAATWSSVCGLVFWSAVYLQQCFTEIQLLCLHHVRAMSYWLSLESEWALGKSCVCAALFWRVRWGFNLCVQSTFMNEFQPRRMTVSGPVKRHVGFLLQRICSAFTDVCMCRRAVLRNCFFRPHLSDMWIHCCRQTDNFVTCLQWAGNNTEISTGCSEVEKVSEKWDVLGFPVFNFIWNNLTLINSTNVTSSVMMTEVEFILLGFAFLLTSQ